MYFIIIFISLVALALLLITESLLQHVVILSFGTAGIVATIAFKIMENNIKRKTILSFGPVKKQLDNLKRVAQQEYPGTFTLVDAFGKSSLFRYTPLKSQQPPIAQYMIFYEDNIVTIFTVHKPELKDIHEAYYNVESYSTIEYMVLYRKALNFALNRQP